MGAASDLPIERMREGTEATEIADTIFGVGVEVVTASYTGDIDSTGIYTNGDSDVLGMTPSDTAWSCRWATSRIPPTLPARQTNPTAPQPILLVRTTTAILIRLPLQGPMMHPIWMSVSFRMANL